MSGSEQSRQVCNRRFIACLQLKTWENRVILSRHDQVALDIRPRCWLRVLKLTRLRLISFEHPQSTSRSNIQSYLIMTQWITLQSLIHFCLSSSLFFSLVHFSPLISLPHSAQERSHSAAPIILSLLKWCHCQIICVPTKPRQVDQM